MPKPGRGGHASGHCECFRAVGGVGSGGLRPSADLACCPTRPWVRPASILTRPEGRMLWLRWWRRTRSSTGIGGSGLDGRATAWRWKGSGLAAGFPAAEHKLLDLGRHERGLFVFPESTHCPTRRCQLAVVAAVAFHVGQELRPPPVPVGRWCRGMLRAGVPEAAVQEHSDALAAENDVRTSSRHRRNRQIDAVAQTSGVQQPPDADLERGVPLPRVPHPPPHRGRTRNRRVLSRRRRLHRWTGRTSTKPDQRRRGASRMSTGGGSTAGRTGATDGVETWAQR